jgi:hypothetical protein
MAKIFQFVSVMQHTALEINYHRVISSAMQHRFGNLIFENFLPPFKISNMVWLRHDLLRTYSGKVAKLTIYASNRMEKTVPPPCYQSTRHRQAYTPQFRIDFRISSRTKN